MASSQNAMDGYANLFPFIENEMHKYKEVDRENGYKTPTHTENNTMYKTKQQRSSRSNKILTEQMKLSDLNNQEYERSDAKRTAKRKAASETNIQVARQPFLPKISNKSSSMTNLTKSRVRLKGDGKVGRSYSEYKDKIMEQRTDSYHLPFSPNRHMYNSNNKKTRNPGRVLHASFYKKPHSERTDRSNQSTLHTKNMVHTWRSEGDILDDVGYIKTPTHFRDLNFIVPHRRTLIRYKGELQHYDNHLIEEERRDESAYDEVLADLEYQQRHANWVYEEFKENVETYRQQQQQQKAAIREDQKLLQHKLMRRDVNGLPELMPLKFSRNARNVDFRNMKQFLKRR